MTGRTLSPEEQRAEWDNTTLMCQEECREIKGPSSCPVLGLHPCNGAGIAWSEDVWGPRPPKRQVRQSWSFVESSAALGFVAALPLRGSDV